MLNFIIEANYRKIFPSVIEIFLVISILFFVYLILPTSVRATTDTSIDRGTDAPGFSCVPPKHDFSSSITLSSPNHGGDYKPGDTVTIRPNTGSFSWVVSQQFYF